MRDTLTGSRIRERRQISGLKQAELAQLVGISASYLNLIEHNRRRIGGKLLVDIAGVLSVEPSVLTQGIEATLIAALREAAAAAVGVQAEQDGIEEFAGRFPGWSGVLAQMHRRVVSLERTVETLSDRLTHDPQLAASMHEVLSTTAAIRSTAAILAEPGEIEAEWRNRFHRNLHQDAERLAESSKALVTFLDESDGQGDRMGVPMDTVEAFLAENGYHFPQLETDPDLDAVLKTGPEGMSAQAIAREILLACASDARALPLDALRAALETHGIDPLSLATLFSVDVQTVLRRLAFLPEEALLRPAGVVICDAAGNVLLYKPVPGLALPRHGETCPLWPLYQALNRPLVPIRKRVVQQSRTDTVFDCVAIAWPLPVSNFNQEPAYRSIMLVLPAKEDAPRDDSTVHAGTSCRVCPSRTCTSRREPSILSEGF